MNIATKGSIAFYVICIACLLLYGVMVGPIC